MTLDEGIEASIAAVGYSILEYTERHIMIRHILGESPVGLAQVECLETVLDADLLSVVGHRVLLRWR